MCPLLAEMLNHADTEIKLLLLCARLAQLVRSLTTNQPGRGLNFGRPSFVTPSVDRDVKPLVLSLNVLSGDLKEPTHLSIGVG